MYSATVKLPKTEFNIRGMSKVKEPEIQQFWHDESVYKSLSQSSKGEVFTLHDGPPYANGDLHCGHALNKILKDFVNKRKLLEGRAARFVPGWDTHGLPIELKVRPREYLCVSVRYDGLAHASGGLDGSAPELQGAKFVT